jgi:hypothetical protein
MLLTRSLASYGIALSKKIERKKKMLKRLLLASVLALPVANAHAQTGTTLDEIAKKMGCHRNPRGPDGI